MKKLLIAAALSGVTAGAFAQGTVFFNNNAANQPAVTVDKTFATGGTYAPANGFTVALYWVNNSSGPFLPMSPLVLTPVAKGVGQFNGGFDTLSTVTIAGQAAGGTGEFEVAGWLGTTFTSFAAAVAGGDKTGVSSPFYNDTGGAGTPAGPGHQLTGWAGQPDLVLSSAPEPTTIALGGLGAAALLLFRRRK